MIKRSFIIFCLVLSGLGAVSSAAEPLSWSVEISAPSVGTFSVASELAQVQVEECEFSPPTTTARQIPCYRNLLYEYQALITVLQQANQLAFIARDPRNTRLPYLLSRSNLEKSEPPSALS